VGFSPPRTRTIVKQTSQPATMPAISSLGTRSPKTTFRRLYRLVIVSMLTAFGAAALKDPDVVGLCLR
jgi:hypothetical protein